MQAIIINAAPMVISRGTQDLSKRPLVREPEAVPQHLAKIYLYAEKGPTTPQLVVGDSRTEMYGADSFDERLSWANHATVFSNKINAEGNAQMIERIIPNDAGPLSNMLLSLDVLPGLIPQYQRSTDGTFLLDINGDKIPVSGGTTVAGYRCKWVLTSVSTQVALDNFGAATIAVGDQTGPGPTQSQRYPILQLKVASRGAEGNNSGLRIWAPTVTALSNVNTPVITNQLAYPFRLAVIRRLNAQSTPRIIESQFSEQSVEFTLKDSVIDPVTDKELNISKFLSQYMNTDPTFPVIYGDFGSLAIYKNNIETLTNLFYAAERLSPYSSNDFTGAVGENYLFNMIGGTSSNNAPYNTFMFTTGGTGTVRLTEFSNLFASGGSDGTMTDAAFALSVAARVVDYADANNKVQDTAVNVESIMYDSGFPLATKYALASFIAVRKDTFLALTTHDVNQPDLTASEEYSVAVALRTRLQLFPESNYFGTPCARAMIVGRSGTLKNSRYSKRVPVLLEVAIKSAKYMGAGNGRWKTGESFDGEPGSVLDYVTDINVTFTSATVRNKDWAVGLNWVQSFDRRSNFFPAFKTIYPDDTSVLNSYFCAMAICQINKVTQSVWRTYSGKDTLTDAQLVTRVNDTVSNRLKDRFDNRFVIIPDAFISDSDKQRGFSWTVPVKIYAPNMKTVMTTSVQAFRIGDLTTV